MENTRFDRFEARAVEWVMGLKARGRLNAESGSEQMIRLRRGLRQAGEQELTPRQRQMLEFYFGRDMTIPQIAEELELNRSTVSRTLCRARNRLYRCLRYAL